MREKNPQFNSLNKKSQLYNKLFFKWYGKDIPNQDVTILKKNTKVEKPNIISNF